MDRKQDIQCVHVLNGTLYSAPAVSTGVDLARHDQVLFGLSITAIGTSTCTFTVQDSDDGVTYASTDYTFDEAAATVNNTRWVFVRATDVRRFVRMRIAPGASGTATLSGFAVLLGATQPPESTTYSIDTSAA